MPTYEDIFFLKSICEKKLLTEEELDNALRAFYLRGCRGETLSLAEVIEKEKCVEKADITKLWNTVLDTINDMRPVDAMLPKKISIKLCEKKRLLGKSSLGATYQAIHPQIGPCALKHLQGIIAGNRKFIYRFLQKNEACKKVSHENCAEIYEVDTLQNTILREMVAGESLEEVLEYNELTIEQAGTVIIQAARGLNAAEQSTVLHKNLKPSNLILGCNGKIKIVDFALPPTTPHYLSPEQCARKKSDIRSDIYSLGIIFYRMLTGKLPFEGKTAQEIMKKHISETPLSLSESMPPFPQSIIAILDKMIEKQPERRYQKYNSLIADLEKSLRQEFEWQENSNIFADVVSLHEDLFSEDREEDSILHTAVMAAVDPPDEVLRHREAKKIARSLIEEIAVENPEDIEQAYKEKRFYQDLEDIFQEYREQYFSLVEIDEQEASTYFDEALELLKNKVAKNLELEVEDDSSIGADFPSAPTKELEETKEEQKSEKSSVGLVFRSIPPKHEQLGKLPEETTEEEPSAGLVFRSIPPKHEQLGKPPEETTKEESSTGLVFRSIPPKHEQLGESSEKEQEEKEDSSDGIGDDSMEAIEVCNDQQDEWQESTELKAEDEGHMAEPLTIPDEEDFAEEVDNKLLSAAEISISSKPIPELRPGDMDGANDEEEEWGPGLKGDEPEKKKIEKEEKGKKLTPYFQFKKNLKERNRPK